MGYHLRSFLLLMVILIIFLIAFVSLRTILSDSNPFYVVASGSMVPVLNINDLIIVWGKDNYTNFNSAKVNYIIIFRAFDPSEENKTIVHRVVKIFQPGDRLAGNDAFNNLCERIPLPLIASTKIIMTKGDANDCSIPYVDVPITQKNYVGKVIYTIPQVGIISQILKPPVNYLIMTVIIIFTLIPLSTKKRKRERGGLRIQMYKNDYLNYYCLNCRIIHKKDSCPQCGSYSKRAIL
jgi:signal peptidase